MDTGFHSLDIIVIFGYFVAITIWGLWLSRKIKSSDSYFRGERKFGWWIMMGQAFGTGTHAENFVAQTGATFHLGFSTIWYQWKNMIITPFYWLIAPWYRRSERTTIGQMVEDRYGSSMGLIYTIYAISFFVFSQGVMLQGAAKVISVASGNLMSPLSVVITMTIAFILYSFFGGLVSSAYLNFVQAMMIIVLSILLIPSGLYAVGGFSGMREVLPADYFKLFSGASGMGVFMILMLAVNGIVGITAQPHILAMCATGSTERAGRVGQTFGSFVKRLCTVGWALTGLIVAALVIGKGVTFPDPEMAFGYATRVLLLPGLTGLMIASIVAANMSTCSTFMVNTGALFTYDFYKKYINSEAADDKMLWMGRYSGLGLTILGVLFALTVKNVLHAFLFTETISAFMGIMIFGGMLWKRANRYGSLAAVISSFGVYYYLNYLNTEQIKLVYTWTPEPFGWAMLIGFASLIVVSLLTKAENEDRIAAFFDNMERLSDKTGVEGEVQLGAAATGVVTAKKPLAKDYGQDLILLDLPGWFTADRWKGFFKRYREDIVGFFLSWGMVGFLVLVAWGIMQIP